MSDAGKKPEATLGLPHSSEVVRSDGGKAPQVTGGVSRAAGGAITEPVNHDGTAQPVKDDKGVPVTDPKAIPQPAADPNAPKADPAADPNKPAEAPKTYTAEQQTAINDPVTGKYAKEFIDSGTLSDASVADAAKTLFPQMDQAAAQQMVKNYIAGQKSVATQPTANTEPEQPARDAANAAIAFEFSKDMSGWNNFNAWAQQNLSDAERASITNAVKNGYQDPITARTVISQFYGRFQASAGAMPRNVVQEGAGGAGAHNPAGFKSQAEMVTAMQDQRYNRDPVYTAEVAQKVAASNFQG